MLSPHVFAELLILEDLQARSRHGFGKPQCSFQSFRLPSGMLEARMMRPDVGSIYGNAETWVQAGDLIADVT